MSHQVIYLGWDPGTKGAIAAVTEKLEPIDCIRFQQSTIPEIVEWIEGLGGNSEVPADFRLRAMIERVASRPGQGVSSTFKFGATYGIAQGVLTALHVPWQLVQPKKWQEGLGVAGLEPKERKKALKGVAQQIYPDQPIVAENADAWLIARHAAKSWG